jgi:hypothetical protein
VIAAPPRETSSPFILAHHNPHNLHKYLHILPHLKHPVIARPFPLGDQLPRHALCGQLQVPGRRRWRCVVAANLPRKHSILSCKALLLALCFSPKSHVTMSRPKEKVGSVSKTRRSFVSLRSSFERSSIGHSVSPDSPFFFNSRFASGWPIQLSCTTLISASDWQRRTCVTPFGQRSRMLGQAKPVSKIRCTAILEYALC